MKKILVFLGVFTILFSMVLGANINNPEKGDVSLTKLVTIHTVNAEESNSVRLPTPVLCPGNYTYRTDCVGEGQGCNPSLCP